MSHVRFLLLNSVSNVSTVMMDILMCVMYVVFIYVNKKGRQYAGLFQIVERGYSGTRTRTNEFSRRHGTAMPYAHGMHGAARVADGGVLHKMEL